MKILGDKAVQSDDEIDFVGLPELSLSLATTDGEVLVVGCSHSSVQKIIAKTKQNTNNDISLVYGGYHMLPYGRDEIKTIAHQLKNELEVKKIAPAHCTGHLSFKILKDTYGDDYIFAGLGERITVDPPLTSSSQSLPIKPKARLIFLIRFSASSITTITTMKVIIP